MDDLLALDGGRSATQWQKRHAKRKAVEAKKRLSAVTRAEAKADLKKRTKKWRQKWEREAKRRKALGLPPPSTHGRPRDISFKRSNFIDMTGQRFGRLTVIRVAPTSKRGGQRCRRWWVKCDCGHAEHLVNGTNLRQGKVLSCGCLKREVVKHNWRYGTLAKRLRAKRRLEQAPLSLRVAELRNRILHQKRIVRADAKLLSLIRKIFVQDEIRRGIRKVQKNGRPMLIQAGKPALH